MPDCGYVRARCTQDCRRDCTTGAARWWRGGPSLIGQNVNNFEVRDLIGQGETGWVYLAQHPIIGRKAALKILKREFSLDEVTIARFMYEARAANALQHPNFVDVTDVGRLPDGLPYLLMELLDGENLGARLRRVGRMALDEALAILDITCAALGAAHRRGIIHGHLKPQNIFLAREPDGREVTKLLDFGVARLRGESGGGTPGGGAQPGAPIYRSPEQCRGAGAAVDARADVYALGTILYEMLCGRPPFQGPAASELVALHLAHAPPAPRVWNPSLSPAIEAVILRTLAKAPGDRFASMAETWEALQVAAAAAPGELRTAAPNNPYLVAPAPVEQAPPVAFLTPAPISVPATPPGGTVWSAPVADITAVVRPLARRLRRLMLPAAVLAVGVVVWLSVLGDARQRDRQRAEDDLIAIPVPALDRAQAPIAPAPPDPTPAPAAPADVLATDQPRPSLRDTSARPNRPVSVRPARRRPVVRIARPAHIRRRSPPARQPWMDKW
jgi:tRNA A-37 threonylcarbamoyl transferase component Bud32